MVSPKTLMEALFEKAEIYLKTSIELAKLKGMETAIAVVSSLVWRLIVIVFVSIFAIFLSIGIAFWLGEILGKWHYGLAIVAVFYLIAALIFHFFMHGWTKRIITNTIVKHTLDK